MALSQIENIIATQQRKCQEYKKREELYRQLIHLKNILVKREIDD